MIGPGSTGRVAVGVLLCLAAAAASAGRMAGPKVVEVPAGEFIAGSGPDEREAAYRLDEMAYGHTVTRQNGWYDGERQRQLVQLGAYAMMRAPVTNDEYAVFTAETGHPQPGISREAWQTQGLIHPFERVRKYLWHDGRPPDGRGGHPVVLVSWDDANAYAGWLSMRTGRKWRLPTELEWEKAARGTDGRLFPWGDRWNPGLLNSHDRGPFDTVTVGTFPGGASPFGMLDAAGQVFEWTASKVEGDRYLVKGGSWDDKGCGVCRPAARHSRPRTIRHILIGFRLLREE